MGFVYYLDYPCEVKEQVRPGRMLRLLYARDRANEALNNARAKDPDVTEDDVRVTLSVPDNERRFLNPSVREIREQYLELDELSALCSDCPARVLKRSFGCRGEIPLPITPLAEAWLMAQIHKEQGDALLDFLEAEGITGNRVSEHRTNGVFFESRKALTRRFPNERKLNVNQLIEFLFLRKRFTVPQARLALTLLGLIESNLSMDKPLNSLPHLFVVEREDAGIVVARTGVRVFENDAKDNCTRELQNFFGGLLLASELTSELWVKTGM